MESNVTLDGDRALAERIMWELEEQYHYTHEYKPESRASDVDIGGVLVRHQNAELGEWRADISWKPGDMQDEICQYPRLSNC